MLKSLDPLAAQVTKLKSLMTSYGEHIDKLPKPEFLNIIKSFIVTEGERDVSKPKLLYRTKVFIGINVREIPLKISSYRC